MPGLVLARDTLRRQDRVASCERVATHLHERRDVLLRWSAARADLVDLHRDTPNLARTHVVEAERRPRYEAFECRALFPHRSARIVPRGVERRKKTPETGQMLRGKLRFPP